jgi:hypothetical protein
VTVTVPDVVTTDFPVAMKTFPHALARLRARGLLVSVPYFTPFADEPAEQGRGRLENYVVARQDPPAGTRVARGATVRLTLALEGLRSPLASLSGPATHPPTVAVPRLVGRTYAEAIDAGDGGYRGFWVRASTVEPLSAAESRRGLDAFVVTRQTPAPGTRVPFGGSIVVNGQRAGNPRLSTVTVELGQRGASATPLPGSRARARVRQALEAVRASAEGRRLSPVFPDRVARLDCQIPVEGSARPIYGRCLTAVDIRERDSVVILSQGWDGRYFRAGARARRFLWLTHTWTFTVSASGHVVRTRSFGSLPPQSAG